MTGYLVIQEFAYLGGALTDERKVHRPRCCTWPVR
jgi:hypothetical protein